MLEGLHAIRRKNRLPPSKNPENLEESVVLRRRNGAAPFQALGAAPRADAEFPAQIDHLQVKLHVKNEGIFQGEQGISSSKMRCSTLPAPLWIRKGRG